jgi:hypothetical protein
MTYQNYPQPDAQQQPPIWQQPTAPVPTPPLRKRWKVAALTAAALIVGICIGGAATSSAKTTSKTASEPGPTVTTTVHAPAPPAARVTVTKQVPGPTVTKTVQAAAPAPANPQLTNGSAVVMQYYQDLTDHNYTAAWNLGGQSMGASYNEWVAGYATTASISVTSYGTYQDGTVWTSISAVQSDGSLRTYTGTYTVATGHIVSAHITQTS